MDFLKFFHNLEGLKKRKREGWIRRGIQNPESMADHSYRVAIMALILSPEAKLDPEKTMSMALLHDALHVFAPDIPSRVDESKQEMSRKDMDTMERKAMKKLLSGLNKKQAERFFEMFLDVEEKRNKEGEFVKDIDRLEMCIQAAEYERKYPKSDMDEFFVYTESRLTHPLIIELFNKLKKEKKK
jgi:putative hydrolase of HD superfamily